MSDEEDVDPVIDAVAMAIRETVADRINWGRPWMKLPEGIKNAYREEAKAAIAAYRKVLPDLRMSDEPA